MNEGLRERISESPKNSSHHLRQMTENFSRLKFKKVVLNDFLVQESYESTFNFIAQFPEDILGIVDNLRDPPIFETSEFVQVKKLVESYANLKGVPNFWRQIQGRIFEDLGFLVVKNSVNKRKSQKMFVTSPVVTSSILDDVYGDIGIRVGLVDNRGGTEFKIQAYDFKLGDKIIPLYLPDGLMFNQENPEEIAFLEYKSNLLSPKTRNQAYIIKLFLDLISSDDGVIILDKLTSRLNLEKAPTKFSILYITQPIQEGIEMVKDILPASKFLYHPFSKKDTQKIAVALVLDYLVDKNNQNGSS